MKNVSSAELKAHMGKYLAMVKEGETLYVTAHRRPVARLSPTDQDAALGVEPPSLPMSVLRGLSGVESSRDVDGVGELLADRRKE